MNVSPSNEYGKWPSNALHWDLHELKSVPSDKTFIRTLIIAEIIIANIWKKLQIYRFTSQNFYYEVPLYEHLSTCFYTKIKHNFYIKYITYNVYRRFDSNRGALTWIIKSESVVLIQYYWNQNKTIAFKLKAL